MRLVNETFGVDFIDFFRARGTRCKPAVLRDHFQAANRSVIARCARLLISPRLVVTILPCRTPGKPWKCFGVAQVVSITPGSIWQILRLRPTGFLAHKRNICGYLAGADHSHVFSSFCIFSLCSFCHIQSQGWLAGPVFQLYQFGNDAFRYSKISALRPCKIREGSV